MNRRRRTDFGAFEWHPPFDELGSSGEMTQARLFRMSFGLWLDWPDVFAADDDIVEPDTVDRIGCDDVVLARSVFGHIMQQPEKVDLELVIGPPAKAFKGFAALFD